MKNLFVYGTLRSDIGHAHQRTVGNGTNLGFGTIPGKMYSAGAYPCVVPATDGSVVKGEIISFSDMSDEQWKQALSALDGYECVPTLYTREEITVRCEDGSLTRAWVYIYARNPNDMSLIPSGDWSDGVSGDHK